MIAALSPYAQGVITPFAVVGALLVIAGFIWALAAAWPSIVWWTVKRLALAPDYRRDVSAAVVGGARKAWCLRIPYGVRIIVALGGTRDEHLAYADLIQAGRKASRATSPKTSGVCLCSDHVEMHTHPAPGDLGVPLGGDAS